MEDIYYIYVFLDQRYSGVWKYKELEFKFKPFYIGKGQNNRIKEHFFPKTLEKNSHKNNTIKKIKTETGELPIHYRIYENLSEEEAFKIEVDFINHFGKKSNKGLLTNQTDGGEGHSGYHEPKISHWKKVYQYTLTGEFIKEWSSVSNIEDELGFRNGNISTAIKRNGSAYNSVWKYEYVEKIDGIIKYQMPTKYENIKQIDAKTDEVIKTFKNEKEALVLLNRISSKGKIIDCINGKSKTAFGFKWQI